MNWRRQRTFQRKSVSAYSCRKYEDRSQKVSLCLVVESSGKGARGQLAKTQVTVSSATADPDRGEEPRTVDR